MYIVMLLIERSLFYTGKTKSNTVVLVPYNGHPHTLFLSIAKCFS